jgi:hypothetical protein
MVKVKRIFRYLRGTTNYSLVYNKAGNAELVGYTDSDWGGDLETRRSTSGHAFLLSGAAISWSSKKQQTVALSSTEAEYVALAGAVQETLYLKSLLADLSYGDGGAPIKIHVDNQSAIKISKNSVLSNRTKHIDIKYHFSRERVDDGTVVLEYIPTEHMLADVLTKAVGSTVLNKLVPKLFGITNILLREGVWNQQEMVHIAQDRELGATSDLEKSMVMAGELTMSLGAKWIDQNGNSNFGDDGQIIGITAVHKASNIRSDAGLPTTADGRTESALVQMIAQSDGGAGSERSLRYQICVFMSQVKSHSAGHAQHSGEARELDLYI